MKLFYSCPGYGNYDWLVRFPSFCRDTGALIPNKEQLCFEAKQTSILHWPRFLAICCPIRLDLVSFLIQYLFLWLHMILAVVLQKDFWISQSLFCRRSVVSVPFPATLKLSLHLMSYMIFFFPVSFLSQVLQLLVSLRTMASLGFCGQPLSGWTGPASSRSSLSGSLPSLFLCMSQQLLSCRRFRRTVVVHICLFVTSL